MSCCVSRRLCTRRWGVKAFTPPLRPPRPDDRCSSTQTGRLSCWSSSCRTSSLSCWSWCRSCSCPWSWPQIYHYREGNKDKMISHHIIMYVRGGGRAYLKSGRRRQNSQKCNLRGELELSPCTMRTINAKGNSSVTSRNTNAATAGTVWRWSNMYQLDRHIKKLAARVVCGGTSSAVA